MEVIREERLCGVQVWAEITDMIHEPRALESTNISDPRTVLACMASCPSTGTALQLHPWGFTLQMRQAISSHKRPFHCPVQHSQDDSRLDLFNSSDKRGKHLCRETRAATEELGVRLQLSKTCSCGLIHSPHCHLCTLHLPWTATCRAKEGGP